MAVLGYTPQFIEQQYVPTQDIGLLSQILGQKQQQYDKAEQMKAAAIADMYNKEVTTGFQPAIQESISAFEKQLQEAVDKRGGDLGAAIGDITTSIGSMYKDPKWKLAAKAVEQQKLYEAARAKNPNLYDIRVPGSVAYTPGMTEEDLMFQVLDPEDIDKTFESLYGKYRDQTGPISFREEDGYTIASQTKGLSPNKIKQLKAEETYSNIYNQFPQLAGYLEQNPQVKQKLQKQIDDKLDTLFKGYDENVVKDSGASRKQLPFDGSNVLNETGYSLVPDSINAYGSDAYKALGNKLAQQEAKKLGIPDVNTFADLQALTEVGVTFTSGYGSPTTGKAFDYEITAESPYYEKAKQALENIEKKRQGEEPGTGLATYNINTLMLASNKSINELEGIKDGLNNSIFSNLNRFTPITNKDKDQLEDITKEFQILDISPSFSRDQAGLVMYVRGKNNDGEIKQSRIYLNPKETLYESTLVNFLNQMNPIIGIQYNYNKLDEQDQENYLNALSQQLPTLEPEAARAVSQFIKQKIKE